MHPNQIAAAAVLGAVALLAACEHRPPPPQIAAPPQQVQTGSTFALGAPLVFPPGDGELLFQNEQLVPAAQLARDQPYCRLAPEAGAPRTIAPGDLTVGSVNYAEREIGTTGGMTSVTRIALSGDPARPGYTLSCGWPQGAPARGFVTTEQIYNAIGGKYFTLNLLR
jgi:hypothetical protein